MHAALCDYIADIVQNSVEADAGKVTVELETGGKDIKVTISDNGRGMSRGTLAAARDPFYTEPGKHRARKVGLGLPFLQEAADQTGGEMKVDSEPGKGTRVYFSFPAGNWDTPPMGDIPSTIVGLMCFNGKSDIVLHRIHAGNSYTVSKSELVEALGELESAGSVEMARKFIMSQEEGLENGPDGE